MPHQWAIGYNSAVDLEDIAPQPAVPEIEPGLLRNDGNGLLQEDGYKSCRLRWSRLTSAQLDALYTQFGWSDTVASVAGTLRTKANADRDFVNYNAIANRPRGRYVLGYWEDVESEVHHMDAL